jgi:hypothetical protein
LVGVQVAVRKGEKPPRMEKVMRRRPRKEEGGGEKNVG